jgi:glycosyltransferase involved in cell wall biosynthesis
MASDSYWLRFARNHRDLIVKTVLNGASTPDTRSLDHAALIQYRAELGIPSDAAFVVGSIGMLRSDRRPCVFLPIISALVQEFGNGVHWIFAGDGPERPELERLVANAGFADNVHFAGVVTDVRYPLSLIGLHFTITVGAFGGVAAIESALAGVPSIALQASIDYQPDPQDWIWSSTSAIRVGEAAIGLLRSPEERMALAARQRDYALTNHSIEGMERSYREVYHALMASVRSSGVDLQRSVKSARTENKAAQVDGGGVGV